MTEKTEADRALDDALNYGTGYTVGGKHVPVEQVVKSGLGLWLDRIERLAFDMPPPNQYTPQIVSATIAARIFAGKTINERDEARVLARELAEALDMVRSADDDVRAGEQPGPIPDGPRRTIDRVLTRARKAGIID